MTILNVPLRDLAFITAGLVKQGVVFQATPDGNGQTYTIRFNGSY